MQLEVVIALGVTLLVVIFATLVTLEWSTPRSYDDCDYDVCSDEHGEGDLVDGPVIFKSPSKLPEQMQS